LALLAVVVTLPPLVFNPRDLFDGFYGPKAQVVILTGSALALWWVFAFSIGHVRVERISPLMLLGLGLAAWATLSVLLSDDPVRGVWGSPGREDGLLVLLSNLAVLSTTATLLSSSGRQVLLRAAVATCLLLAVYGIAQHFGLDADGLSAMRAFVRSSATFRNPLFFAGYLVLLAPLVLATCSGGRRGRWIPLGGLAMGVLLAALLFTYSRGAWLGALIALGGYLVVLLVTSPRLALRAIMVLVIGTSIATAIAAVPRTAMPLEHHSIRADTQDLVSPANPRNDGRIAIWYIALRMISDRPWLGLGPDQMGSHFEAYRTDAFSQAEGAQVIADRAHSEPLHLAVTLGLPGALLSLLLSGAVMLRTARASLIRPLPPCWLGVLFGCAGYLTQSVVSITVPGVHTIFYLLLGGLLAAVHTGRGEEHR